MMQIARKKLVLDHLIVQKMDDSEPGGDDVQSTLMHGAQALFTDDADQASRDITCTPPTALVSAAVRHSHFLIQTPRRT